MKNIDVHFFKPFVDGTIQMLEIQCSCPSKYLSPYLKDKNSKQAGIAIAGMVGIWTNRYKGIICLCFPEETFLKIISQMLGEEYKVIDDENRDGAGEMMNIVFGLAKRVLNEQGHCFEKALPGVITGKDLVVSHSPDAPVFVLPFETPHGNFQLEIGLVSVD